MILVSQSLTRPLPSQMARWTYWTQDAVQRLRSSLGQESASVVRGRLASVEQGRGERQQVQLSLERQRRRFACLLSLPWRRLDRQSRDLDVREGRIKEDSRTRFAFLCISPLLCIRVLLISSDVHLVAVQYELVLPNLSSSVETKHSILHLTGLETVALHEQKHRRSPTTAWRGRSARPWRE